MKSIAFFCVCLGEYLILSHFYGITKAVCEKTKAMKSKKHYLCQRKQ